MRLPRTANDDHPGPIGWRQISRGGDRDQSALMRTPRTTPSRCGPRNPGQSDPTFVAVSVAAVAAISSLAGTADVPAGVVAGAAGADDTSAGGAGATGFSGAFGVGAATRGRIGSSPARARSRSSGDGVHRQ